MRSSNHEAALSALESAAGLCPDESGILPTVWILWHRRVGDYHQMLALAQALECPWHVRKIRFRSPEISSLAPWLLDREASDPLLPPWPDIVLCAEALCVRVARRLQRLSGGRTRIVVLGRPPGAAAGYDLILTTAQYRLPPASNVIELDLPLTLGPPRERSSDPPESCKAVFRRPVILVLAGASSSPDWLDAAVADTMCDVLAAYAERMDGALVIHLSPRTEATVEKAFARLRSPHRLEAYRPAPDNPYWHLMRMADEIVVTSDSVSMVADALSAGKPVHVYALPRRHTPTFRLSEWLHERAVQRDSVLSGSLAWLFETGMIEVSADRRRLFDKLVSEGRVSWFGAAEPVVRGEPRRQDLAVAVGAVRRLLNKSSED